MTEAKGKYVKHGDVEEWVWDKDVPSGPKLTGGWVVPEGEFDPRAEVDTRSATEKHAEASQGPGLKVVEEPKVTTKTAEPLTKK